jgi:hypothetical protein
LWFQHYSLKELGSVPILLLGKKKKTGELKAQVLTTSRELSEEETVAHAALRVVFEKLLYCK